MESMATRPSLREMVSYYHMESGIATASGEDLWETLVCGKIVGIYDSCIDIPGGGWYISNL